MVTTARVMQSFAEIQPSFIVYFVVNRLNGLLISRLRLICRERIKSQVYIVHVGSKRLILTGTAKNDQTGQLSPTCIFYNKTEVEINNR